jgi:aminomethyltransferase
MAERLPNSPLERTPLHRLHVDRGARLVPFAGYEMPLQYGLGVLKEHLHVRAAAGLFDVSHMGQLAVRPRSGRIEDAALALERVMPVDVLGLPTGRQRYALLTNDMGGILDDLMIGHLGDHFFVVVNAACKEADEAHLRAKISQDCTIERLQERALLSLQGPAAEAVLTRWIPDVVSMRFMDVRAVSVGDLTWIVSRSGYTGEDGFEISIPSEQAESVACRLLDAPEAEVIGLGARDSLRLEAGLCLYGADIDATTTPSEAALEWAIQKSRRSGGARAGGFPGADRILAELSRATSRRRVGLEVQGRAPVRANAGLFADAQGGDSIGRVTSGAFGPSVNGPVAMAYVAHAQATPGTKLFAELRGRRVPLRVREMPFVTARYKR